MLRERTEGSPEFEIVIVRLFDPCEGIHRAERRMVIGEDRSNGLASDVGARSDMRQHLVRRPLAASGRPMQLIFRQTARCRGDARRCSLKQRQDLLDRE